MELYTTAVCKILFVNNKYTCTCILYNNNYYLLLLNNYKCIVLTSFNTIHFIKYLHPMV